MSREQGLKHDENKLDLSLLSYNLLESISKVELYSKNLRNIGNNIPILLSLAIKHIFLFKDVSDIDNDTGLRNIDLSLYYTYLASFFINIQDETQMFKIDLKDKDILPFTNISYKVMEEITRVRLFGLLKYQKDNWKKGFKYTRSISAFLRHIYAFVNGELLDKESNLSHLAHAMCCLEHLLNDIECNKFNDDRFRRVS